jgi:hypothetical protein
VRNGERLTRRYLSRTGHDYIQLTAKKGRTLRAWAVLKQRHDVLEWIDLLWDGEHQHALIALDDAADKIAKAKKLQKIEMWLVHDSQVAHVLEKRGWVVGEHPEHLHLTSISFNPEANERILLDSFYITMGDSDLV